MRSDGSPDGNGFHAGQVRVATSRVAASLAVAGVVAFGFLGVSAQLVRLALSGQGGDAQLNMTRPVVSTYARPDIVDRKGRLLATDLAAFSLYADPYNMLDADEASEALARMFPDLDQRVLRAQLADNTRRFVWIKRGLSPQVAQRIHNLGLLGLAFRTEPKRRYPQGRLAGHVVGSVSVDNKGLSGIEQQIDRAMGLESGLAGETTRPPVALTIDIGAQHGLEEELALAIARYRARGAAGILLDVNSGDVLAAASLPDVDPAKPADALEPARVDRLKVATYELGSVFKLFTVAMALEYGTATAATVIDVREPIEAGSHTIRDPYPAGRPLTVEEIFLKSSNVGAGRLALQVGAKRQRAFLTRMGLLGQLRTEAGTVTAPWLPQFWGEAEIVTISYGHGLAVAPLQFAVSAAALVNGGRKIEPRFVQVAPGTAPAEDASGQVLTPQTSAIIRGLMERNVTDPKGTGRRAAVPGIEIGGKTGTAELAINGSYRAKSVVTSFLAAFPIRAPRYLLLITLVEPNPAVGMGGMITAGTNAAPVAGRVIRRVAPLLDLPHG